MAPAPAWKVTALSLAVSIAVCAAFASTAHALDVELVNKSGRANDHVYVMLQNGSSSDGQLQNLVPVRLSAIRNRRFSLAGIGGGRIYFSYDEPVAFNEPPQSRTRYDKVELTYPGTSNLTAVDFFGIPFKIQAEAANGNPLGSLSFDADTKTVKRDLLAIPGADGALVKTSAGDFARVLSPQLSQSSYPSFASYIASLSGQTVTVRGSFFGQPFQTFVYSGTFGADGTITLNGTITPQGGSPTPGEALTVAGSSLPSAIYTVDGPFTRGGQVHHVSDNDVYAAIYRDLLAGFAWGYWGGKYGNDNSQWQGKPPFVAARTSPASYATYNEYAAVIYEHSDAYGFSFSDTGPKKVQLPLDGAANLEVTILPDGDVPLGVRGPVDRKRELLRAANVPQPGSVLNVEGGSATVGKAACRPACGTVGLRAKPVAGGSGAATAARGRPTRIAARGSARVRRGDDRRLAVSLTRSARKRLGRSGRLRIRLRVSLRRRGGDRIRASRALVLKRERH